MSPCQWSSAALGACSHPISCRDFLFCGVLDLRVNRPSLPRLFKFPCQHSSEDSDPLFKMTRKRRRRMMPLLVLLKKDVLSHASPPEFELPPTSSFAQQRCFESRLSTQDRGPASFNSCKLTFSNSWLRQSSRPQEEEHPLLVSGTPTTSFGMENWWTI